MVKVTENLTKLQKKKSGLDQSRAKGREKDDVREQENAKQSKKNEEKKKSPKIIAHTKDQFYGHRQGFVYRVLVALFIVVVFVASFADLALRAASARSVASREFKESNCTVEKLILEVRENVSHIVWRSMPTILGFSSQTLHLKVSDAAFTSGGGKTTLYRALVDVRLGNEDPEGLQRCAMQYFDGSYDPNRTRVEVFLDKLKAGRVRPCWHSLLDLSAQDSTCEIIVQNPSFSTSWIGFSRGV